VNHATSQYANILKQAVFSPVLREILLVYNDDETNVPAYQGGNDDDSMGGTNVGLLRLTKWYRLNVHSIACELCGATWECTHTILLG